MAWTDLKAFVGSNDDAYVEDCYNQAMALVDAFIGTNDVPESVIDRAYLMCGSELFHQRNAPNGIAQFADFNGAPVRIARDPMTPVYALVQGFMVIGL